MSGYGPFETARRRRAMSEFEGKAEDICSHRVLLTLTDAVEKVFLCRRTQILRVVGAPMRKLFGGIHHQAVNSPVTSLVELRAHRMVIAACFIFRREISRSVFWDFFDSIDP